MVNALFYKSKKYLEKSIDIICSFFFFTIFALALAQIFMRWIVKSPFMWSEELIRLMYVWICYLGWTLAMRNKTHIKINLFVMKLPPLGRKILETINCLLVIIFSVFMIFYGIKLIIAIGNGKAMTLPIPFGIVYFIAPFTNFIILLYQLAEIVSIWKTPGRAEAC